MDAKSVNKSERKLNTAILGLSDGGQLLLEAASRVEHFQIRAVADKDAKLTERLAGQYACTAHDDYRQLIMQEQFDCLLVSAGLYSCEEHIRTAMKRKFNVLKLAPQARNFEEAVGFVRLAEAEGVKFVIANLGRFADSYLALRNYLQHGEIEQVFLITGFYNAGDQAGPAWYTDPKLAGGGVLLRNCYEIIDQMMWNFSLPQQVYSLTASQAADKQQRLYLAEDLAVVTMKFSDTLLGNCVAFRRADIKPGEQVIKIYGKGKVLTVTNTELVVSNNLGQSVNHFKYDYDALDCMKKLLKNFAKSILTPEKEKDEFYDNGRENLNNMAVIESAYLSARTGFPEEPGKVLQMASRSGGGQQAFNW